ncbi:MAG: DapH/DapD/GlmU-related protein [Oscillospiraceae bacterium]
MNNIAATAKIMQGTIIGENVQIDDNVFIDYNCIIRDNVHIKKDSKIGAGCILGEYLADFYEDCKNKKHPLVIGENALIRSYSIIYGDTQTGDYFQTGHRVTIREESSIGNHVRVGTLSDIQGRCSIGNYVSIHSDVFIGEKSTVGDFVWLFPHVVLTNDPTPPSNQLAGITIEPFAVVSAGSVVLPGVHIGKDALIGAGANVTKDVPAESIFVGNPAKCIGNISKIKNRFSGEQVYPWRYTFCRGMPWNGSDYDTWAKENGYS